MMNRIEAKGTAKALLRGRTFQDGLIFCAILLCVQIAPSVLRIQLSPFNPLRFYRAAASGSLWDMGAYFAGLGVRSFLLSLTAGILTALAGLLLHGGLVRASLRLLSGDGDVRAVDTVLVFNRLGKYVLIALCEALLLTAWSLPSLGLVICAAVSFLACAVREHIRLGLGLAVPLLAAAAAWGWYIAIAKPLQYFFAFHACADNPDLGAMDCIRESSRLTAGRKGGLFVMELSFLGWRLLDALFFPQIYTIPYRYLTYAAVYRQLQGEQAAAPRPVRSAPGVDAALPTEAADRPSPMLVFLSGEYAGSQLSTADGGEIRIGRDSTQAHVVISERCPQISGLHCGVRYDGASDCYIVTDYSANGTFAEGVRLPPGSTKVRRGAVIKLAEGEVLFRLV